MKPAKHVGDRDRRGRCAGHRLHARLAGPDDLDRADAAVVGRHGLRTATGTVEAPANLAQPALATTVRVELSGLSARCSGDQIIGAELAWKPWGAHGPEEGTAMAVATSSATFYAQLPLARDDKALYQVRVMFKDESVLTLPDNLADPYYQLYQGRTVPLYCTDFEDGNPLAAGWTIGTSDGRPSPWAWGCAERGRDRSARRVQHLARAGAGAGGDYAPKTSSYVLASHASASPPAVDVVATTPVVEILDPSGAIDATAAGDAFGKLARELAGCGGDGWTGDALAWIVVDWHGKVVKLELAVDKPAVETCLRAEQRKLVIPKAQGRATIFARLHLAPALAGGKKVGERAPEEAPIKRGEVRAIRIGPGAQFADPERVRDALRQQLQDVTVCYEQALEARRRLGGGAAIELTVATTVATTGAVTSAAVGSAPGNMADCVERAMLRVRLPAPAAADKVVVELQLEPTS